MIINTQIAGGGGPAPAPASMDDPIRFFDYDGELVASYSSVPASLPSVPTHNGLTGGTWNYTLAQITTQFNAVGACDVGANYTTSSGATEIDIELHIGRLHPYLSLAVDGTVSIDWGDNTTPDSVTGTSIAARLTTIHHTYSQAGRYTIKVSKTNGNGYALIGTNLYPLLNANSSSVANNSVYVNCVKYVRMGPNCTIGDYGLFRCFSMKAISIHPSVSSMGAQSFYYCYSLRYAVIPSGVTTIGNSVFYACYSLSSVSIPNGVTTIALNTFQNCYSLTSLVLPSQLASIGNSAFDGCLSLSSAVIPSGVTTIGTRTFNSGTCLSSVTIQNGLTTIPEQFAYSCTTLTSATIPSSVTSIGAKAFGGCNGMAEYHFKRTESVPTLANTNAFQNIASDCKIYVPASKLADYQTANYWSTYASYMVGE